MMDTLRRQAATKSASAGGHVFFAQFRREARDYLLVAIITDKLSATLTANLDMEDVQHLDLDGFRFAGRINLTGWAAGEERYISFLKGEGRRLRLLQGVPGLRLRHPGSEGHGRSRVSVEGLRRRQEDGGC